jgi:NAD-dependent deacetylase
MALARLQRDWKQNVLIVTQNIDNLHERAGSTDVIHMHGELLKARCARCAAVVDCLDHLNPESKCNMCGATGSMRPHVVWFGEMPMQMDRIQQALERADLFLAIGTSGSVYPAAGFVDIARGVGAHTAELSLESSLNASVFDEAIYGPATIVVTKYVEELLASVH